MSAIAALLSAAWGRVAGWAAALGAAVQSRTLGTPRSASQRAAVSVSAVAIPAPRAGSVT